MGDMASFEVNTTAFEAAMQRLKKGVREGFVSPEMGTLTVQGRLLAQRCQDFTPPRDVGQGKAATMKDLMAVYFPLAPTTFTNKGIQRIVRKDDRQAWNVVSPRLSSLHGLKDTTAIAFSEERHQRLRNQRGRVRSKYSNLGSVTLGPEAQKARAYMKMVVKRVGWARAGWNMGIVGLGGHVAASWVSRHGVARGRLVDGRSDPDPFIQVINDTGWARSRGGSEGERILRNAVAARARDMESYFNRMMKLAADRAQTAA